MEIKNELDRQFFAEIMSSSDRTAVIAATAYLEDKLRDAIEANLRADTDSANRLLKPTGALGGLHNKAELGYLMSLYTKGTRDDIQIMAAIRNKFAHWAKPISFGHQIIREDVEKIGLHARIFKTEWDVPKPWDSNFARFSFISDIDMLSGHLIEMARNPNHPKIVF